MGSMHQLMPHMHAFSMIAVGEGKTSCLDPSSLPLHAFCNPESRRSHSSTSTRKGYNHIVFGRMASSETLLKNCLITGHNMFVPKTFDGSFNILTDIYPTEGCLPNYKLGKRSFFNGFGKVDSLMDSLTNLEIGSISYAAAEYRSLARISPLPMDIWFSSAVNIFPYSLTAYQWNEILHHISTYILLSLNGIVFAWILDRLQLRHRIAVL